jgi:hypothetical protein
MAKGSGDKYLDCLREALTKARYGPVRQKEAHAAYQRAVDGYVAKGMGLNDARPAAMQEITDRLTARALEKQDRVIATTKKLGEMQASLVETMADATGKWYDRSIGVRAYEAYLGKFEDVSRLKTSRGNFQAEKDVALGNLTSMFRSVMDDFSKNWLGINRGSVDAADIADAVLGLGKPSQAAKNIADTLAKMWKYTATELGLNGVAVPKEFGMPFQPNKVKLENMGEDAFVKMAMDRTNWNKSGNGYFIRENEREAFLRSYWYAHVHEVWDQAEQFNTNAALKGIPRPYEFTGGQFSRDFQNFTMLQFKDGKAYAEMHTALMDGDFLSTTQRLIEKQAHNLALAKVFGPSPQHAADAMAKMTVDAAKAAKFPKQSISNMNRLMRRAKNVRELAFKENPMDGESRLAMTVSMVSNIMNSAMLNGALITSIPGDFATMLSHRFSNNEALIGPMGQYLKDFLNTATARRDALGMGHIYSEYMGQMTYSAHQHSGFALGEHYTKVLADKTMKANLMNRHFDAMTTADFKWRAFQLFEDRNLAYGQARMKDVLENNNITPAEWDKTRKAMEGQAFQPADDVRLFRPLDHFDTLGTELVHKWQRLFWNESRKSVLRSSMEAQAIAMAGSRADTFTGALRKSTVAFQSYGITYGLNMGRAIMHGSPGERLGAFARIGVSAVIAGAIATQARNLWQGKTLEDMTSVSFWTKVIGSALGPWGAIATGGLRTDPASAVIKAAGGPLLQFTADLYARTAGSAFQFMDMGEGSSTWLGSKEGIKWLDFIRQNFAPQTFYSTLLLQRYVLEPLEKSMNADMMKKRIKAQRARAKGAGAPFREGVGPGGGAFFPGF